VLAPREIEADEDATPRYETVPYARAAEGENYMLSYSAYDNNYNYYVYYLGHVNKVPVAYRPAVIWDGVTPQTVGYSREVVSETTIEESTDIAFEQSVTKTWGGSLNTSATFSANVPGGIFESEFSIGGEVSYGNEQGTTHARSNTYGSARTFSEGEEDSFSMTIGEHGEPVGKYRYSLFATTDVYYVVITDRGKTRKQDEYVSVLARPDSYAWGLDYDPDIGGGFYKTAPGQLLGIPDLALSELPEPSHVLDANNIPDRQKLPAPVTNPRGGEFTSEQRVRLAAEPGASIYYTTDGSVPTRSSAKFTATSPDIVLAFVNQQTITYRINAVAAMEGYVDSPMISEVYTIRDPLVTGWTRTWSGRQQFIEDGDQWTLPFQITPQWDIGALKSRGYNYFEIQVDYGLYGTSSGDDDGVEVFLTFNGGTQIAYTARDAPQNSNMSMYTLYMNQSRNTHTDLDDLSNASQTLNLNFYAAEDVHVGNFTVRMWATQ
jgi:hypothetical protein